MFNPFAKKDGTDEVPLLTALKNGFKAITDSDQESHSEKTHEVQNIQNAKDDADIIPSVAKEEYAKKASSIKVPSSLQEVPDIDAVAGYILQFASEIGKADLLNMDHNLDRESLLDVRNFKAVLYFADWEFTRRNNRRLTEITWYSSDYDYNVNTASRFDVILDHDLFTFAYKTLGEKKSNEILYKIGLHPEAIRHDFAASLDNETKIHLEYIVAACLSSTCRPRTFPAGYEPKNGDARTYYDLDLVDIADIERREHRTNVSPFVNLREKRFEPATFEMLRNEIQFDFYRSFDNHDPRFAHALLKITGDTFFKDNPEKLHIRSAFPTPLWEMNKDISLTATDAVGIGSEYIVNIVGRSFYIFAELTPAEYASLTESQREFFKPSPVNDMEATVEGSSFYDFRGDCILGISCHVALNALGDGKLKTSFGEVSFRLA